MSFMDIPEQERVVAEAFRVLEPGGFLQFSISHPCFATPRWRWILHGEGERVALECGDHFRNLHGEIEEWIFSKTPPGLRGKLPPFPVPRFTGTLSDWLNLLIRTGFTLEAFAEHRADEQTAAQEPRVADTRIIAYFLILRCRKA